MLRKLANPEQISTNIFQIFEGSTGCCVGKNYHYIKHRIAANAQQIAGGVDAIAVRVYNPKDATNIAYSNYDTIIVPFEKVAYNKKELRIQILKAMRTIGFANDASAGILPAYRTDAAGDLIIYTEFDQKHALSGIRFVNGTFANTDNDYQHQNKKLRKVCLVTVKITPTSVTTVSHDTYGSGTYTAPSTLSDATVIASNFSNIQSQIGKVIFNVMKAELANNEVTLTVAFYDKTFTKLNGSTLETTKCFNDIIAISDWV